MGQLAETQISLTERLTADSVMCYMKGDFEGAVVFLSAVCNITGQELPDGKPLPNLNDGLDLAYSRAMRKYYLRCVPLVSTLLNGHYSEIRKHYANSDLPR